MENYKMANMDSSAAFIKEYQEDLKKAEEQIALLEHWKSQIDKMKIDPIMLHLYTQIEEISKRCGNQFRFKKGRQAYAVFLMKPICVPNDLSDLEAEKRSMAGLFCSVFGIRLLWSLNPSLMIAV